MNHYSTPAVCGFLFETGCGIRVAGENLFVIAPVPGGSLTYARAVYDSPHGQVVSGWKRAAEGIRFAVEIPANTTAELRLPDGKAELLNRGRHVYVCNS